MVSCAAHPGDASSISPRKISDEDVLWGDIKSDEDYVVVDGKDVGALIEELRRQGLDDLGGGSDYLELDEENGPAWTLGNSTEEEGEIAGDTAAMEYFTDDNVAHMPKWAKQAYLEGSHTEIEEGALKIGSEKGRRRLHSLFSAKNSNDGKLNIGNATVPLPGDAALEKGGIFECTVGDVADDYEVPVEFVVDAFIEYGVKRPVEVTDAITERLNTEQMERLLHLIVSFDAKDICDRYSDKSIMELAEDYDLDVNEIVDVCDSEDIYLPLEEKTRLQLTREDRVLDIILKDAPRKQPYPSLLQGLQNAA